MADEMKQQIGSGVVALVARSEDKRLARGRRDDDLTGRFNAVDLVRLGSEASAARAAAAAPTWRRPAVPTPAAPRRRWPPSSRRCARPAKRPDTRPG